MVEVGHLIAELGLVGEHQKAVGESLGMRRPLRVDFIPEPKLGDYVIVHAGFTIERLPEKQALEDLESWEELRDVL